MKRDPRKNDENLLVFLRFSHRKGLMICKNKPILLSEQENVGKYYMPKIYHNIQYHFTIYVILTVLLKYTYKHTLLYTQ